MKNLIYDIYLECYFKYYTMTVKQEVPTFDTYIQYTLELAGFPRDKSLKRKIRENETPEQRKKRLKKENEYKKKI